MKRLSCPQFLSVFVIAASCGMANADPVTINVTGNVVASPCTLDAAASNLSPSLGDIQATALSAAGSSSSWVPFDLKLKDCPAGTTKATVTFSGEPDTASPASMYANTGDATMVAVELQDTDGTLLGNGKSATGTIETDHTYTYKLQTRAYSTEGGVFPGTISAVIQATFTYQ
ncbi:fimbrial protein [Citrobacter amalonaticus]|uniref:fimbrial protein n=2 Tax=Citrobacter amalonaticus TaxID=35703 RepID=UPI00255B15F6|nr:fimbrial protein [Citrobacter amalonaticus]MDL4623303.1 fimbrial protein [Citrobacter amalonaticus]